MSGDKKTCEGETTEARLRCVRTVDNTRLNSNTRKYIYSSTTYLSRNQNSESQYFRVLEVSVIDTYPTNHMVQIKMASIVFYSSTAICLYLMTLDYNNHGYTLLRHT